MSLMSSILAPNAPFHISKQKSTTKHLPLVEDGRVFPLYTSAGLSLEGQLGEKVSQNWLTSPYFEQREKFKYIVHIGKSKVLTKPA